VELADAKAVALQIAGQELRDVGFVVKDGDVLWGGYVLYCSVWARLHKESLRAR
jgi:hypothetical protein